MKWLPRRISPDAEEALQRAVPVTILLMALALRLWRLGGANVWWDEALAVWGIRKGLAGVTLWTASDVHPPFYFWSLWAWVQLAGESEFAIRALSVLFGVLTVAVVYRLGTLVAGRATGSVAALLTALSRFHIWWSQEARMYMLAGLAGTLSLYLFLSWWRRLSTARRLNTAGRLSTAEELDTAGGEIRFAVADGSSDESLADGGVRVERGRARWGASLRALIARPMVLLSLYVLATTAAIYSVLLMAAILVAENLAFLAGLFLVEGARRKGLLLRWVAAQGVILALAAAWLAFSWGRMQTWSTAEPMGLLLYLRLYATLLITGISVNIGQVTWALALPLALLVVGLALFWRGRRQEPAGWRARALAALTLALAVIIPGIAIFAATLPRGLFYTPRVEARYFLPFAPAFWVLLAWSLTLVARRWRIVGRVVGLGLLALWISFLPGYYTGRHLHDELQSMARAIVSQAEPGDVVLLDSGSRYPVFLYYYDAFRDIPRPPVLGIPPGEGALTADQVEGVMSPIAGQYRRIWLAEVDVTLNDPDRLAESWLANHLPRVLQLSYGYNSLYLFAPTDSGAADGAAVGPLLADNGYLPQHVANLPMGTGGQLWGWELPVTAFGPGENIHVSLLWDRLPEEPVEVTLRALNGKAVQSARLPAPATRDRQRQQADFLVYPTMPEGEYRVILSTSSGGDIPLGRVAIVGTRPLPKGQAPDVALSAQLGDDIALLGYTLRAGNGKALGSVKPGDTLQLDLYWRAEKKPQQNYTVFTHLLGEAYNPRTQGPVWGQHDSQPADDGYPTTQWPEGAIIVDRHLIVVDEQALAGSYTLEIGMYNAADGTRLPVRLDDTGSVDNRIVLPISVQVGGN